MRTKLKRYVRVYARRVTRVVVQFCAIFVFGVASFAMLFHELAHFWIGAEKQWYAQATMIESNVVALIAEEYGYKQQEVRAMIPVRRRTWEEVADEQADLRGINRCFLRAMIQVETDNGKNMVSEAGAMGHMQLMPATAKHYGLETEGERLDPEENIPAGSMHIDELLAKYEVVSALMVYNAGPKRVGKTKENIEYPEKILRAWLECKA